MLQKLLGGRLDGEASAKDDADAEGVGTYASSPIGPTPVFPIFFFPLPRNEPSLCPMSYRWKRSRWKFHVLRSVVPIANHQLAKQLVSDVLASRLRWVFILSRWLLNLSRRLHRHASCTSPRQRMRAAVRACAVSPLFRCTEPTASARTRPPLALRHPLQPAR